VCGREHARVVDGVIARWGHARGQPAQQRQGVHVHRDRAVGVGPLQLDAHEAVLEREHAVLGEGRAHNVAQEGFATVGIEGPRARGGVEGEPAERRAQRLLVREGVRLGWRQPPPPLRPPRRGLAGNGRGGQLALRVVRGFPLVLGGAEETSPTQLPLHAADHAGEHVADLARLQMAQAFPAKLASILVPGAVEDDGMEVRGQPEVGQGPLEDGDGAGRGARDTLLGRALAVEPLHRLQEDPREAREQGAVHGETPSPREREGEDPLPEGALGRQHLLHEVRGGRTHAPTEAGGAEAPALTTERHDPLRAAVPASPRLRLR
jgi:hypothetical protein